MKVYHNHDGGVDDFASLLTLILAPQVELVGVGVVDADTYIDPAVRVTQKLLHRYGAPISVARSSAKTNHPFPKEWRMDAFTVDALPILNEFGEGDVQIAQQDAAHELVDLLQASAEPITLIFTGPLSDLAQALAIDPTIVDKIAHLHWMGGTFGTGNIAEPEQDNTAEWNAYWDSQAVKNVLDAHIPMTMVGLESTQQVPLTPARRLHWAKSRRFEVLDLIGQMYASVPPLVHFATNSTYYLWDVLTTVQAIGPADIVHKTAKQTDVVVGGVSDGRTFENSSGHWLDFVDNVDADLFFHTWEEILLTE